MVFFSVVLFCVPLSVLNVNFPIFFCKKKYSLFASLARYLCIYSVTINQFKMNNKQLNLLSRQADSIFDMEAILRKSRFDLTTLIMREFGGEITFEYRDIGVLCGDQWHDIESFVLVGDDDYEVYAKDRNTGCLLDLDDIDRYQIGVSNVYYDSLLEVLYELIKK